MNNIKRAKHIIEEVKDVVCNWERYAREVEVSKELTRSIARTLVAPNF